MRSESNTFDLNSQIKLLDEKLLNFERVESLLARPSHPIIDHEILAKMKLVELTKFESL